jgi:glycosyltransferase involved in cell wall biosynthesis
MAMAKQIISTKVADIPEILAYIGYLVEPRSPEQLAAMISEVFNHLDSANARGIKARERCIASYSTTAMATTLSRLITSLEAKY